MPVKNENNGLADLFDDLMSGRKTVDEIKEELKEASIFLRAGNNYRRLTFNGFARIEGKSANVYLVGDKIDSEGKPVEAKKRTPKVGATKRK